jgi:DNA-binding transcriptional LysR family regulator
MKLELFDLRLFINIAEQSSLTKGAERSCISLPAASARVKHLERVASATLFSRKSHGVELTPAGRLMLAHARRISIQVDNMTADLREHSGAAQTHIRLMATTIAMAGKLPARIGTFLNAHPTAVVDITERRSTGIVEALLEGHADIGVLNESAVVDGFEQYTFARDRLVMAVPKGHRFSAKKAMLFRETLDERQIAMPVGSSVGGVLLDIATAAGRERAFGTRVTSFESLCQLVDQGIGIGVLPQSCADRYSGKIDVVFVPLSDSWAEIVVKLVIREDVLVHRLARALFDHLRTIG